MRRERDFLRPRQGHVGWAKAAAAEYSSGFSERLRTVRESRGMSAAELAWATGLSHATFTQYEAGDSLPSGDSLIRIALALGVSSDRLLGLPQELADIVRPKEMDKDGWRPFKAGSGMPPDPELIVEVLLRNEAEGKVPYDKSIKKALCFYWGKNEERDYDIVAYRVWGRKA